MRQANSSETLTYFAQSTGLVVASIHLQCVDKWYVRRTRGKLFGSENDAINGQDNSEIICSQDKKPQGRNGSYVGFGNGRKAASPKRPFEWPFPPPISPFQFRPGPVVDDDDHSNYQLRRRGLNEVTTRPSQRYL